ncbi:hypothetical protein BJ546DRAFT_314339 [Cryomyces antarcticus]
MPLRPYQAYPGGQAPNPNQPSYGAPSPQPPYGSSPFQSQPPPQPGYPPVSLQPAYGQPQYGQQPQPGQSPYGHQQPYGQTPQAQHSRPPPPPPQQQPGGYPVQQPYGAPYGTQAPPYLPAPGAGPGYVGFLVLLRADRARTAADVPLSLGTARSARSISTSTTGWISLCPTSRSALRAAGRSALSTQS